MACECVCLNARRSSHSRSRCVAFVGSIYWLDAVTRAFARYRLLGSALIRFDARLIASHWAL